MDFCKLCKTEGENAGNCKNCGNTYFNGAAHFIYDKTEKDSTCSECILTNKYLIVRHVPKKELVSGTAMVAAGGLLGAAVNSAINKARKMVFGFYDINEIEKVIYPFNAKGIKTDTAFRVVNKDGSDFILHFDLNGMFCKKIAKQFQGALETAGIKVEQGSSEKQPVCCQKPFVNELNFFLRVAHSAGKFVQLAEGQFVAPPCTADTDDTPLPETTSQPEISPADTTPVEQEVIFETSDTASEEFSDTPTKEVCEEVTATEEEVLSPEITAEISQANPTEPEQTETMKPLRFCGKCGFPAYIADQLYCADCGAKLI